MAFINRCSELLSGVTCLSLVDHCTSSDEVIFYWGAQLIDKHSRALPIDLGSDSEKFLNLSFLFPNVEPKSKQPKQHEINRKLLIKCL